MTFADNAPASTRGEPAASHPRSGRHRRLAAVGVAFSLLFTVACSSDDDDAAGNGTTSTAPSGDDNGANGRPLPAERDRPDGPAAALVGELTGGDGVMVTDFMPEVIEAAGYSTVEFAVEGSAVRYTVDDPESDLPADGRFNLTEGDNADYRTRIVVRRPEDPARFNGTVIVEWMNVSGGVDANPDWVYLHEEILRGGYAWVGVSTQHIGIEGGPVAVVVDVAEADGVAGAGLKAIDPERYGELNHPGDAFMYDIYTQVARLLAEGGEDGPLQGLDPEVLIATGESQSAFALTTYANGVQPDAQVFDAFFVHSRGGSALPLGEPDAGVGIADALAGTPTIIRTDLGVPALILQTESDTIGLLNYFPARQDDTDTIRVWEVAGSAHAEQYMLGERGDDLCPTPINDGPTHYMARSGLRHLDTWARGGEAPPIGDRYVVDDSGDAPSYERDQDGIVLGGIRTPAVDVPVAVLSSEVAPDAGIACLLMGSTLEMTPERLIELHGSAEAYTEAYEAATDAAIDAGFVLEDDRDAMLADAEPDRLAL